MSKKEVKEGENVKLTYIPKLGDMGLRIELGDVEVYLSEQEKTFTVSKEVYDSAVFLKDKTKFKEV